MDSWSSLSMRQRADVMKLAVENGIHDLDTIRSAYNEFAEGGSIHIKPSHRGRLTELKERTGKTEAELYKTGSPATRKMITFARNARKWKHGIGGNLFRIGGDTSHYDTPQTFAGRLAQVAGASPRTVRGADVISSVAQMTPYGYTTAALDLGRDMNRVYHGEEGALGDAGLDLLGMIPGVSKLGLKKIKPKAVMDKVKQGYNEFLQPVRQSVNSAINTFKALDFIDDTLGADKTSDTKQSKRKHGLGGYLYPDGGYVREVNNHPIAFDAEGNLVDQVTGEKGYLPLPEVYVTANPDNVARGRAQRWYRDFGIESNDATSVASGRRQNSHLDERGIEGAVKAAAWAKDHPVLNNVGLGLSTLPLAAAATPAVVGGGELAATALANPYVDAALTSMGGAHAAHSLANGEANWMTALELAPLGRLAKPLYEGVVQPGMRLFNSPLTGNWTKIGNREYRLSPNSLGANGSPLESRATPSWVEELPLDESRYYRQVGPDALDSYRANGVVSQFNKYGINPTRYEVPMFTKGKPSLYRGETKKYGDVWVVSKPEANLKWESVKGAAVSPKYNGEFNSAPVSEFEFYQYDPAKGYIKLDEGLNLPNGINFSRTPHIDYLKGLSEQQQIEYLTQNGLNDQWLWALKNNPDHLESALSKAPIPNTPQITAENAASITPEQWDAAYRAAYERGDREEGQRLWDLWFKKQAPDTQIVDEAGNPTHAYHGTGKHFNEFDTTGKYSTLDEGYYGVGAYFAPNKELAQMYADTERTPVMYDTYLNIKNPLRHVRDENADLYGKAIVDNDGVISTLPDDLVDETFDMTEFVATKPNQIKLAEPFTLADDGSLINLTKRANFNINDIRYGLLPFLGLGTAATLYGRSNE